MDDKLLLSREEAIRALGVIGWLRSEAEDLLDAPDEISRLRLRLKVHDRIYAEVKTKIRG